MAISYSVDAKGNIFKNGVFVPAANYKYIPTDVIATAAAAKKAPTTVAAKPVQPTQKIAQTATTKAETVAAATASGSALTDKQKREKERDAFTGWDNDPQVKSIQEKWWQIYIDTGRKDTADQKALNELAQKTRSYNNPMYNASSSPSGPTDWMDAEKVTPRDTTPNANGVEGGLDSIVDVNKFGTYAQYGLLAIGGMFILSMFRR